MASVTSSSRSLFAVVLFLCQLLPNFSECPNACSGKGICGPFSECICYKNRIGNDCSQRQCQFGMAYIDLPKGDLDGSGTITGPSKRVVVKSRSYPYGTSEQYPNVVDSDQNVLTNSGHEYVECSNKGKCDRVTGECSCLPGYEGSACQRASCPISQGETCSGHGVCESARKLAWLDGGNEYALWDADITMGCLCDAGYYGPACSYRKCKTGFDPIYQDPEYTRRYSNWSYVLHTRQNTSRIQGNYSIIFTNEYGSKYKTVPINYGATCLAVTRALEALPNNAIPPGSVRCTLWSNYETISQADEPIQGGPCIYYVTGCAGAVRIKPNMFFGMKYTLAFPLNPGVLPPLEIDYYLDGSRPTLFTNEGGVTTLGAFVYANGFQGEYQEYFTSKCLGVDVTLVTVYESSTNPTYTLLGGLTDLEMRHLQMCLGDSDNIPTYDGSGVYEGAPYTWDYGTVLHPHLVRLVDRTPLPTTDLCDSVHATQTTSDPYYTGYNGGRLSISAGRSCPKPSPPGFIAPLLWDPSLSAFRLLTRPGEDYSPSTTFAVFTTTSIASMVSDSVKIVTDPQSPYNSTVYTLNATNIYAPYRGSLDCQTNPPAVNGAFDCLKKGDRVFFLDPRSTPNNPKYLNIHTVRRVYNAHHQFPLYPSYSRILLDSAATFYWHNADKTVSGRIYKFVPAPPSFGVLPLDSYPYVAECSNRGICQQDVGSSGEGDCQCFAGFTGADCSTPEAQDDGVVATI